MLLKVKGIDVNQADKDGCTPLYIATQKGHLDVMKSLYACGANTDVVLTSGENKGATMLWAAAWNGKIDSVVLGIEWGLNATTCL